MAASRLLAAASVSGASGRPFSALASLSKASWICWASSGAGLASVTTSSACKLHSRLTWLNLSSVLGTPETIVGQAGHYCKLACHSAEREAQSVGPSAAS